MFTKFCLFFVILIFIPFFSSYSGEKYAETLIIVDNFEEMKNVKNFIEANGGRNIHIYPPSVLISILPENFEFKPRQEQFIKEFTTTAVDVNKYSEMGTDAIYAIEAWNNNFHGFSKSKGLDELPSPNALPLVGDAIVEKGDQYPQIPVEKKPFGAGFDDTSEFLLGNISVAVIFVESDGSIDPQTENWISSRESQCVSEIQNGLNWVSVQNPDADLSFTYHFYYGRTNSDAQTGYEPINRHYYEDDLWQNEIMGNFGYSGSNVYRQRYFINDIIDGDDTHWGVIVWVVDSAVDTDGMFESGYFAYARPGGPYIVMTYKNDGWGISNMDAVIAHEIEHSFYALDEYESAGVPCTAHRGYLDIENQNSEYGSCNSNVNCLMRSEYLSSTQVCDYSNGQIGWYDDDSDGIPNILDTEPITDLDPVPTGIVYYKLLPGNVNINPLNNLNPVGSGNDITINTAGVEFNIDGLGWYNDGVILNDNNDFVVGPFSDGTHTIQVRATNSAGNVDATPESFTRTFETKLTSLSSTATASGGGRKVWATPYWDPDDIWETRPGNRVIYEDNGDIYYLEYRVDNTSGQYFYWTNEVLISDGNGNSKYPCLEVYQGGGYYNVHVVWQQYNPVTQNYEIKHTVNDHNGWTGYWQTPHTPYIGESTSPEAKPVIGGFGYPSYAVVWNSGNGIKYWSTLTSPAVLISQNSSLCINPTISTGGYAYHHYPVSIAWEKSGDIFYKDFLESEDPVTAPIENITGSYSYLYNCQNPSVASHYSGEIMLTWQGRHGNYAEKTVNNIEGSIPPPVSMKYDPIFARKKSYFESEWSTLKEIMYSTYKQITPSVGSIFYDDFSVIWKVKDQNKIAKLDYIGGEGWDLDSEIEIFTSTGCNNPSISSASNVISAVWSENSASPFKIHHEQLVNPTESKHSKNIKNRAYRKSLIDLSKIDENLEGYVSITMGEIEDLDNQLLVRFKQDSLTYGSFMSSPVFNPGTAYPVVKMNYGVFGDGIKIKNLTSVQNANLFRVVLKSSKNNIIRVLRNFKLKDLEPDSSGTFLEWKELKINFQSLIGKDSRIEVELFPNTNIKYKPSVVEVLYFDPEIGTPKMNNNEMALSKVNNKNILTITDFALYSAYPNPFNPVTNITFDIPNQSKVSLVVYNIQGQIVSELFKGNKETGRYSFQFDGSNLSSGVYFYELVAGEYKEVRKMMLVK